MDAIPTTLDGLLNRRVAIEQPAAGYRIAADTVLLAAAVPALAGDRLLDLGCGVGGAILCVAARVEGVRGLGIDIQPELVELCRRNIARNAFARNIVAKPGDARQLIAELPGLFDHALMNPPYHEEERHDPSPDAIKQTANMDKAGDLEEWIETAAVALKPAGTLSLIHRFDRHEEVLACLMEHFGEVEILPLLPKEGAAAKRVVMRARKGDIFAPRLCRALVLHKTEGGYSDAAEAILRDAQPLVFQSP